MNAAYPILNKISMGQKISFKLTNLKLSYNYE